jgi:hypothetical protein
VTCFLSGILVAALLEQVNFTEFGWQPVSSLAVVLVAGVLGWFSWRSYITILQRAEFYGERSNCPSCGAYGRFDVEATGMDEHPGKVADAVAPLPAAWLRVKCRTCGTGWRMPE